MRHVGALWLWETPRERLTQEAGVRSVSVLGKGNLGVHHSIDYTSLTGIRAYNGHLIKVHFPLLTQQ